MGNNERSNRFLYLFKFIACLFVITIHAPFPGVFGDVIGSISRFAVPFFFAVSGRYLLTDKEKGLVSDTKDIRDIVAKRLFKLLKTTAVVYLIYLAYSLIWHLYMGIGISEWLSSKFNLVEGRNFLLFNSGKFIYDGSYTFDHLWYLFALIYVYVLIIIFAPVLRKWYKGLIVILIFFLYFGEALQTYYPIRPFDISISTWYILRNWLFVGMPFVLIGILFSDHIQYLKENKPEVFTAEGSSGYRNLGMALAFLGLILGFIERSIFGAKEVYIGSLIIVTGLLLISEFVTYRGGKLWILGKDSSSLIYYFHVLVIAILDFLSQNGIIPVYTMAQKPIIVIILCMICFGGVPTLLSRGSFNEQK